MLRFVRVVGNDVPVLAGPTTLNTRDTIERAKFARDIGADGLLLGRPMWCQLSPEATLEFYQDVAQAVPELGIILYDNPTAFKNEFDLSLWEQIADVPQVIGAKYITLDDSYRDIFERVMGKLRMMTFEHEWFTARQMFPEDAKACWSGSASCDPTPVVALRNALEADELKVAERLMNQLAEANRPMIPNGDMRTFESRSPLHGNRCVE